MSDLTPEQITAEKVEFSKRISALWSNDQLEIAWQSWLAAKAQAAEESKKHTWYEGNVDISVENFMALRLKLAAAEKTIRELRETVRKYGYHTVACKRMPRGGTVRRDIPCTCGFEGAASAPSVSPLDTEESECPRCEGSELYNGKPCAICNGTGKISEASLLGVLPVSHLPPATPELAQRAIAQRTEYEKLEAAASNLLAMFRQAMREELGPTVSPEPPKCTSQYHDPVALYCLACLPKNAPLGVLLIGTREPTKDEIKRGLELEREGAATVSQPDTPPRYIGPKFESFSHPVIEPAEPAAPPPTQTLFTATNRPDPKDETRVMDTPAQTEDKP